MHLEYYEPETLQRIIERSAGILGVDARFGIDVEIRVLPAGGRQQEKGDGAEAPEHGTIFHHATKI